MSNKPIFGNSEKHLDISGKELREHNLEEVVKECIHQFNQNNRRFIVVYGNPFNYNLFKKRLLERYNRGLVFRRRFNTFNPEMFNGKYDDSKIVIHDAYKKTAARLDLIYVIDLDKILKLKKFSA